MFVLVLLAWIPIAICALLWWLAGGLIVGLFFSGVGAVAEFFLLGLICWPFFAIYERLPSTKQKRAAEKADREKRFAMYEERRQARRDRRAPVVNVVKGNAKAFAASYKEARHKGD